MCLIQPRLEWPTVIVDKLYNFDRLLFRTGLTYKLQVALHIFFHQKRLTKLPILRLNFGDALKFVIFANF